MSDDSVTGIKSVELVNIDRLTPPEWNPRLITSAAYRQLCESIKRDPKFLEQRPILALSDGTIYAGSMRYRAVRHLYTIDEWESPWGPRVVPAIMEDVPETVAKERAIRDNLHMGEFQELELAEILVELKDADEASLASLGFTDDDLKAILSSVGVDDYEGSLRDLDPNEVETFDDRRSTDDEEARPAGFREYGEDTETQYRCPSCSYEWRGSPKPAGRSDGQAAVPGADDDGDPDDPE